MLLIFVCRDSPSFDGTLLARLRLGSEMPGDRIEPVVAEQPDARLQSILAHDPRDRLVVDMRDHRRQSREPQIRHVL